MFTFLFCFLHRSRVSADDVESDDRREHLSFSSVKYEIKKIKKPSEVAEEKIKHCKVIWSNRVSILMCHCIFPAENVKV